MVILKSLRILIVHFSAALAIWLSTYIVGLDILLSLVYLVMISLEARDLRMASTSVKGLVAVIWLTIPIIFSIMTSFYLSGITIFLLEFWYTPILPLLSIKTVLFASGKPLYYYLLLLMPLIYSGHFFLLIKKPKMNIK